MLHSLPTLYGRTSTGKIVQWTVSSENEEVVVCYGQCGGKIAEKRTTSKPKNLGRANETTGEQQAVLEAQSKWNKQLKKDYREDVDDIPQSTLPNLAHKYQDKKHLIDWDNSFTLTKLDGVRGSVFYKDGEMVFQSRGGEHYPVIPAIAKELEVIFFSSNPDLYVDGEFYHKDLCLEDITSCVKKHNEDTEIIEFHVFDLVNLQEPSETWETRYVNYKTQIIMSETRTTRVHACHATPSISEEIMFDDHRIAVDAGEEGVILREKGAIYNFGNRTTGIIKYKVPESQEFMVIGFEEDKNGAGVPVCNYLTPSGEVDTFKAPFATTAEKRKALFANRRKLIGKYLTVDFEKLSKYGKPTKPIGKAFRDVDEFGNPKQ